MSPTNGAGAGAIAFAALRERVQPDAGNTRFSKEQCTEIFRLYLADFKTTLRPEQLNRTWAYHKSCCESKLKTDAGSRFVAYAIWEVGLPPVPLFATEQRCRQLSVEELEAVPEAIRNVLNWLDRLATTLIHHRTASEQQES